MSVDQHAEHTEGFIVFDEAHSSHVSSEVVDQNRPIQGPLTGFLPLEIEHEVINIVKNLIPLAGGFAVHRTNAAMPLAPQVGD
jgi:hypothetical protein